MTGRARFLSVLLLVSLPGGLSAAVAPPPDGALAQTLDGAKAKMLTEPAQAKTEARRAAGLAQLLPSAVARGNGLASALWLEGEANIRLGNIEEAKPLIGRAEQIVLRSSPGSKLQADILLSKGGIEEAENKAGIALALYQRAFEIYRKLGENRSQAMALSYIGSLYNVAMDGDSALKYYGQAFDAYSADPKLAAIMKNNKGNALRALGRYREAAEEFRESYVLTKKLSSPALEVGVLINLASVQLLNDDMSGADKTIDIARRIAASADGKDFDVELFSIEAQFAYQRHQISAAEALVRKAFAGVNLETTTVGLRDAHQTAWRVYTAANEPALALAHLTAMKRLDDAATKLATSSNTALMAARFDFANQELKIAKLKANELQRSIDYERARVNTQRMVFSIVGVATALIIAMLGFALFTSRRSRDKVRAANADLAVTNTALGKALAAKTEFLATTSHEIRTPLNGILGMAQVMLADSSLADDVRERITVVHGAGLTMRALVDDILDVAKIETGNLTIESAPFDLKATIQEASLMWEAQAEAKGVGFVRLLDDCPTMIEGDAARVRQIVFNLVSNALKFTATGSVGLRATATGDGRYAIAVSDTGIGIAAAKREEIFESFRQADAGTTRQFGGTGLGLAICRNLARAMGGDVSVDSVIGQGSTFTVSLPLVEAAVPQPCSTVAEEGEPGLLVIDRNPISRSMFRTLLAPHAGTVVFASSESEAAQCIRSGAATRVLIDDATMRAGGDAFAAIRIVTDAAREVGVRTTLLWPISDLPERDELMKAGVDSIVAKPVSGTALVAALFNSSDNGPIDLRAVSQAA